MRETYHNSNQYLLHLSFIVYSFLQLSFSNPRIRIFSFLGSRLILVTAPEIGRASPRVSEVRSTWSLSLLPLCCPRLRLRLRLCYLLLNVLFLLSLMSSPAGCHNRLVMGSYSGDAAVTGNRLTAVVLNCSRCVM